MALQDTGIVLFGYFQILCRSEVVVIHMSHISYTLAGGRLLIPSSKTDQAGRGVYILILPTVPGLGQTRPWLDKLQVEWALRFGEDAPLCVKYAAKEKSLVSTPLTADALSACLRYWLVTHAGYSSEGAKTFSSHSLRRGGAT